MSWTSSESSLILSAQTLTYDTESIFAVQYVMSSKNIELAREAVKVAKLYEVPMLGLPGSAHQQACEESSVEFIPEFYADLQYDDNVSSSRIFRFMKQRELSS